MVKSRNHRNFSRLALDSQLQSLSQTSWAQMKLKIAVAPPAFSCIFFLAEILSSACKEGGPVFLILFIVLIRKFLLLVGYRIIDCGLSTTILWTSLRNADFYMKIEYFTITTVFFLIKMLLLLEESSFLFSSFHFID